MSDEKRPPLKSAQQFLLVGMLVGVLLGCLGGAGLTWTYTNTSDIVYKGGAYPNELTIGYQSHYMNMVIDSFVVNRNVEDVKSRLQSFSQASQIRGLANQSVMYAVSGRTTEADTINDLAAQLKAAGGWQDNTIQAVIGELKQQAQAANDAARMQAIDQFSLKLLNSVPQLPAPQPDQTPVAGQPTAVVGQPPVVTPTEPEGTSWTTYCMYGFLILLVVGAILIGIFAYFREQNRQALIRKKQIKFEGEGTPPIMQWSSTYTFGRDPYDESFTLETKEGAFMGEAGISMNDADDEDRVINFDAWVFDKTDIKTYSRMLMCKASYEDEGIMNRLKFNELAEAVLVEPNKVSVIESQTMRVEIKIEELELGENGSYFNKLKVFYNVFLKDGVNISVGEMVVPEHVVK